MTTPASPSTPNRAGDDRNLVAVDSNTAATFDDKLHLFWQRNRTVIAAVCVLVLLGIIGKYGWDEVARKKELDIEKSYAAATTPEQLKAFAVANPNHALAGIAQLRNADEAYKAGKSAEAIAGYEQALAVLKNGPLAARAQLGRALAKVQGGKTAEATSELKQLVNDANQLKAIRTEAGYQLASLSAEAGNSADAQKFSDQLLQIDPSSPWTQRAMALRATLPPVPAAAPAAGNAPAGSQKKEDAPAAVQVKIPGK